MKKPENLERKAEEKIERNPLRRSKLASLILIIFFALMSIKNFNWSNTIQGIDLFCRLSECVTSGNIDGGDSYYYLYMGQRFQNFRGIESGYLWILNLWPPGMGIYYAVLSRFTFGLIGIPAMHLILLISLWYGLIGSLTLRAQSQLRVWAVTLLGLVFLNSAMFKNWILSDGLLHSEGIAIYFLCQAVVFFLKGNLRHQKVNLYTFFAGISLAIASYLRGGFDLAAIVISILALSFRVLYLNTSRREKAKNEKNQGIRNRTKSNKSKRNRHKSKSGKTQKSTRISFYKGLLKNNMTSLEFMTLIYFCLTLPWRLVLIVVKGSPTFVPNSNQIWINSWIPTNKLQETSGGYFVEAGMNGFCQAYQERCATLASAINPTESLYQSAAIQELINNPFPWIESRINIASVQLYRSYSFYPEGISTIKSSVNLLMFVCQILIMFYLGYLFFKKMNKSERSETNFLLLPMVVISIAPLLISSFEPRYFYPASSVIWIFLMFKIATPAKEIVKPTQGVKGETRQNV